MGAILFGKGHNSVDALFHVENTHLETFIEWLACLLFFLGSSPAFFPFASVKTAAEVLAGLVAAKAVVKPLPACSTNRLQTKDEVSLGTVLPSMCSVIFFQNFEPA